MIVERVKKITIQDVARYANVSVGTIDRVIHNRGKVSPEKRHKIKEAIKKLNFNPNLLARTLAMGKTFSISTLIPAAPFPRHYWSMPFQGIELAANRYKDYGIITENHFYDLFDEASFSKQANKILQSKPDGVILAPLFFQESTVFVKKLEALGIPYIFIDADLPAEHSLSYIGPDVKHSAYIAAKLLHCVLPEAGKVLIVHIVKGFSNASALRRIEDGFKSFFMENDLNEQWPVQTLTINSAPQETVFSELARYYQEHPGIQGVFVSNSKAHLLSELHRQLNLNIKLVGYDLVEENIRHMKAGRIDFIISQSPFQQGERALQTFFDNFFFKKEPDKIQYVPLDIIIKENIDFYTGFNRSYHVDSISTK